MATHPPIIVDSKGNIYGRLSINRHAYGVTDEFLDYMGIESTKDLPVLEEIKVDDEETNLFESRYKE